MDLLRRRIALSPLALGLGCSAAPAGHAGALPAAQSLAPELAQALGAGKPLLVMASLDGCPFCKLVRDHHLAPLLREGAAAVVQLDMGSAQAVTGFDGKPGTHQGLLRAWSVKVAPTVLFFGKGAREVAPRLEGSSIPDFYGAYLDERLRTARLAVG